MKIIRRSAQRTSITYSLNFTWRGDSGAGFYFPCDKDGIVDLEAAPEAARRNLASCLSGEFNVVAEGVQVLENAWREPAVGRCDCGREVELAGFTNTCECGLEYNSAGQQLAPREQWGEETGEHPADIARAGLEGDDWSEDY
jgi:hypothetical protein